MLTNLHVVQRNKNPASRSTVHGRVGTVFGSRGNDPTDDILGEFRICFGQHGQERVVDQAAAKGDNPHRRSQPIRATIVKPRIAGGMTGVLGTVGERAQRRLVLVGPAVQVCGPIKKTRGTPSTTDPRPETTFGQRPVEVTIGIRRVGAGAMIKPNGPSLGSSSIGQQEQEVAICCLILFP